ncbi:MAG: hypothetical protein QOF99_1994 [Pseudonocardiales bacterium]|nr:hypothetical protein [Pseudonocardiales bacterium]
MTAAVARLPIVCLAVGVAELPRVDFGQRGLCPLDRRDGLIDSWDPAPLESSWCMRPVSVSQGGSRFLDSVVDDHVPG